ncbi:unnamed protein product, partial [Didymodactylos carnosus]
KIYFLKLKYINLTNNNFTLLINISGTQILSIETSLLSHNPFEIVDSTECFHSLKLSDISFTSIKHLFNINILPSIETIIYQSCHQASWQWKSMIENCIKYKHLLN